MAKIIKFALELKDGESARTIEDLRQHFDLEKVVAYFMNGRLLTWLKHRHLDEEAAALEKLSAEDTGFARKLCDILGVAYEEHQEQADAIDANALMADHERLNRLRQVTTDPEILAKVDRVAFDEKDLRRLAFDHEPEVYLCNGRFVIPLNVQNKHYIGIGKAEAVIVSDEWIDFDGKEIKFTNVSFDEEYQQKAETPEKWLERGLAAEKDENYDEAMKWYQKAVDVGNGAAMRQIGIMYFSGKGVSQDYSEARKWYQKAADAGNSESMATLAYIYYYGEGVPQNYNEAFKWYQKAANASIVDAFRAIGDMYAEGKAVAQNDEKAFEWHKKGADAGDILAMFYTGFHYWKGTGVEKDRSKANACFQKVEECCKLKGDYRELWWLGDSFSTGFDGVIDKQEAIRWYLKSAHYGESYAMYRLGIMYYNGDGVDCNYEQSRAWMQKAANAGYDDAKKWLQEH